MTHVGKCKRKIWKIQTKKTENANGKYGKYGSSKRKFQWENRYETPKTLYLTPKSRYGPKEVNTRQNCRYGQWRTPKMEDKFGKDQREKVGTGKTQKIFFFLSACFLPLFCDYLRSMEYLQDFSQCRKCKARKAGLNQRNT